MDKHSILESCIKPFVLGFLVYIFHNAFVSPLNPEALRFGIGMVIATAIWELGYQLVYRYRHPSA